jgi:hypothetical protein
MRKILLTIIAFACVSAAWLGGANPAYGQKATEQFIPIGKSPGLSGKYTWVGTIEQFDEQKKSLTVKTESGSKTLTVTDQTRIWLDRSKARLSNINGGFADLKKDRRVEMKYIKDRESELEWIKIEVAE